MAEIKIRGDVSGSTTIKAPDSGLDEVIELSSALASKLDTTVTTKGDLITYGTAPARLGIGTNGHVLTADSSEALGVKWAASSGALVFLNRTTFSAVSSVSVNSVFSSTYDAYMLSMFLESASTAPIDVQLRMRVSGVDDTGTNYQFQTDKRKYSDNVLTTLNAGNGTTFPFLEAGNAAGIADIMIAGPGTANQTAIVATGAGIDRRTVMGGRHTLGTAYDGFSVVLNTGTITGAICTYGLVKS